MEEEVEYSDGEHCCPLGLRAPCQRCYGSHGGVAPCNKELVGVRSNRADHSTAHLINLRPIGD